MRIVPWSLTACYASGGRRFLSKGVTFTSGQFGRLMHIRPASELPDTRESADASQRGELGNQAGSRVIETIRPRVARATMAWKTSTKPHG